MATTARREFLRFLAASPLGIAAWVGTDDAASIKDPAEAINVFDFEPAARKAIPPAHFGYLATGVDDDRTLKENHEAYSRIQLRPRRLVDVSHVDASTNLLGTLWPTPVFLCPCGSQKAFHPDGELAAARAGGTRTTLQILSTVTTVSVEDVTKAAGRPVWQQLYLTSKWETTERIVRRAEDAGCPVLVVTIDVAVGRNTETEARWKRLDTRRCATCHPRPSFSGRKPMFDGVNTEGLSLNTPTLDWNTIRRIRALSKMRLVLKGVETGEDARLAVEHGIDGVIVSNHGGRATETGRATIDCLPEVVDAVRGRMPVMLDGGIRRGTDILKALALGAKAVGIGRPYLWGLGAFGQAGVERVLDILRKELLLVMAQCGARNLAEITPALVRRAG